jgi:hypothetical protein
MKTLLTVALLVGLFACQDAPLDESYSVTANEISAGEITAAGLPAETTKKILTGYLSIKDALVITDPDEASFAAEGLLFVFEENEDALLKKLFLEVQLIAESKNAEQQRIYFEGLSANIYTLVKNSSHEGITVYQQYCPMAFENKGAYWISDEEKVYNPYFGDKMLRCGRTTEMIE